MLSSTTVTLSFFRFFFGSSFSAFERSQHKTVVVVFGCPGVGTRVRACRGVGAGVAMFSRACLSRDESVSRKRFWHTLFPSVHPSKPSVGTRSGPAFCGRTLQGAQILGWFLLQSRRWLRRYVKQSVLTSAHFRLRRHVGRWSRSSRCMLTLWCLWCLPMCQCATNEVVQFFVFCKKCIY